MTRAKTALVILAQGAEEMEAVISIDVLRRGGLEVTIGGLDGPEPVKCSRGVVVTPDIDLHEVVNRTFDVVVLPGGGEGAQRLCASAAVGEVLRRHVEAEKLVAAICAAPSAVKTHGLFQGYTMTSHPVVRAFLEDWGKYVEGPVVKDRRLITSRGPGTAFAFALAVLEELTDERAVASVTAPMMFA